MKTFIKLLLIWLTLLLFAWETRAQSDSIPEWPIVEYAHGFKETHYPFLCVKYNAKDKVSHLYSCYPHKMFFSVNGKTAVRMGRRDVIDVKGEHFVLTVTRKNYSRKYIL